MTEPTSISMASQSQRGDLSYGNSGLKVLATGPFGTLSLVGIILLSMRSFIISPVFEVVAILEQAWLVALVLFLLFRLLPLVFPQYYAFLK